MNVWIPGYQKVKLPSRFGTQLLVCAQVKSFKEYVDLYIKNKVDDNGAPIQLVHEVCSDRWEVAVTLSDKGFQQASFVNSIATTKVRTITSCFSSSWEFLSFFYILEYYF